MRCARALAYLAVLHAAAADVGRRSVPEFEVDLDAAPERRFAQIATHFNSSIQHFYQHLNNFAVRFLLKHLSGRRGPEPDELQKEIQGVAAVTKLPEYGIAFLQMLYELNTLMVPIENITLPKLTAPLAGPACTGILARNADDGMVYHVRNLDFAPASYLQNLVYTGIFKKGGKELFRAQMIAGYQLPLTAMKKGANGFSYEVNTRYLDHAGGNSEMWKNLFTEKRPLNGWTARKAIEDSEGYEEFVEKLSTSPYVSTMYNVIGGVRKGTILARNPDGLAHKMTLGEANFQCPDDYIIITNFDYFFHDVREWFDPTGGKGMGHPRRPAAQRILNGSKVLTPEVLVSALDDFEVMAKDTIFQAVINVETGLWNVSMPACTDCPKTHPHAEEAVEAAILV